MSVLDLLIPDFSIDNSILLKQVNFYFSNRVTVEIYYLIVYPELSNQRWYMENNIELLISNLFYVE